MWHICGYSKAPIVTRLLINYHQTLARQKRDLLFAVVMRNTCKAAIQSTLDSARIREIATQKRTAFVVHFTTRRMQRMLARY